MAEPSQCDCGSGQIPFAVNDGYGIFLFYGCNKCARNKLKRFRTDIMERYETDEPIEPEEY